MFCSRLTNNMIDKIHERATKIVLNDHVSDFETMLWNITDIIVTIEIFKLLRTPVMDSMLNGRTICHNFRKLPDRKIQVPLGIYWCLVCGVLS